MVCAGRDATVGVDWLSKGKLNLMKRRFYLLVVLVIVAIGVNSCIKHNASGPTRLGKWVVFGGCSHYVIQLMDATAADSNVVTSWTDTSTNITYTNVFGMRNGACGIAVATLVDSLKVGDEFYFTLNGPVPEEICMGCAIWPYAMPAKSNSVTNVRSLPH